MVKVVILDVVVVVVVMVVVEVVEGMDTLEVKRERQTDRQTEKRICLHGPVICFTI